MTARMAAKYQTTKHVMSERLGRGERGADALEYVGMLVVAGLILAALWTAFNAYDFDAKVKKILDDLFKIK